MTWKRYGGGGNFQSGKVGKGKAVPARAAKRNHTTKRQPHKAEKVYGLYRQKSPMWGKGVVWRKFFQIRRGNTQHEKKVIPRPRDTHNPTARGGNEGVKRARGENVHCPSILIATTTTCINSGIWESGRNQQRRLKNMPQGNIYHKKDGKPKRKQGGSFGERRPDFNKGHSPLVMIQQTKESTTVVRRMGNSQSRKKNELGRKLFKNTTYCLN